MPTSSMNMLAWLANAHDPTLEPGPGTWARWTGTRLGLDYVDRYNQIASALQLLGSFDYMATSREDGTVVRRQAYGLARWILDHEGDLGYRVHATGIDGGQFIDGPDFHLVTFDEVKGILAQGAIGVMTFGHYDVAFEGDGVYRTTERDGGHAVTVVGVDRVGDDLFIDVHDPWSGDAFDRQDRFRIRRYRVEPVTFRIFRPGIGWVEYERYWLLRAGRTVQTTDLFEVKLLDRFSFLRPTWALAAYVEQSVTVFSTELGELTGEIQLEIPPDRSPLDFSLSPDQLSAVVASVGDDGANGELLRFDLDTGLPTTVADLAGFRELAMTRFGTVLALEAGGRLRHLSPHLDADAVALGEHVEGVEALHVAVDDATDRAWILDPAGSLVSLALPGLDDRQTHALPAGRDWGTATDFQLGTTDDTRYWFAVGGDLVELWKPHPKDPIEVVTYASPLPGMPVESVQVDELGRVVLTMGDDGPRTVRTYAPDRDTATLELVPTMFDALDLGVTIKPTWGRTNVALALESDPGNVNLDIEALGLEDWLGPEQPGEPGATCGPVDELEDLVDDAAPVEPRPLDGVEIAFSTASGIPLRARTYGDDGGRAFAGAEGAEDRPFALFGVSGERFMSASYNGVQLFHMHQPITFTFSAPVSGFGLTTIDLLEDVATADEWVRLRAFDASGQELAVHERQGPQGPSGVVLRWFVEASEGGIASVVLEGEIADSGGGYGIDDLELCREPCPGDLDGDGLVGLGDLLVVLAAWGPCDGDCVADLDGDGEVGLAELLSVLASWGPC